MPSVKILSDSAKSKREAAAGHNADADKLIAQAKEIRDLADLEIMEAEEIEADIDLIKSRGAPHEPRVFAGRRAKN